MPITPLTAELTLDDKGRVHLPREIARHLQEQGISMMVAFGKEGPDGGLSFLPVAEFQKLRARYTAKGPLHPNSRLFSMAIESLATRVRIDGSGRMSIPVATRRTFGLDRDLYLFTSGEWFELWSRPRWEAVLRQAAERWQAVTGFEAVEQIEDAPREEGDDR